MSRRPALLLNLSIAAIIPLCTALSAAPAAEQEREGRSDSDITERVQLALADVHGSDTSRIEVQTRNGIVQLTGFVDTDRTRATAQEAAMDVPGVRHVRNEVVVRAHASAQATTGPPSSDAVIAARVKTELAGESGLATASAVEVEVNDGIVRLSGIVSSPDQRSEIESVVRRIEGVTAVRNNVEVQPER